MSDKKLLIGIILLVVTTVISFHATDVYATIAMVPDFVFGAGSDVNGNFTSPLSVVIDSNGNVFIVDTGNNRVQKFLPNGTHILSIGSTGSSLGKFDSPDGITIDSSDNIYVVDTANDRVQKLNENGSALSQIGTTGSGDGQFQLPIDVAVNSTGFIFVTDKTRNNVQIFDSSGFHVLTFDKSGGLTDPESIAINNTGHVFVGDTSTNRIEIFDKGGNFVIQIDPSMDPSDIFINSTNQVFVVDEGTNTVKIFDSDVANPTSFGSTGSDKKEFEGSTGIAVNSTNFIYVVDTGNHGFSVFNKTFGHRFSIGGNVTADGLPKEPTQVARDGSDNIYVIDQGNDRVQKFNANNGNFISKFGSFGTSNGEFDTPIGIAVNSTGHIFVGDDGNDRVQIFDSSFVHKQNIDTSGTIAGLAVNGTRLFVSDGTNNEIDVYRLDTGTLLTSFDSGSLTNPRGVAVNSTGHIFVAADDEVEVYDSNTNFIASLDGAPPDTPSLTFLFPNDVIVDDDDFVYVTDVSAIYKLDSDGDTVQRYAGFGITGSGGFGDLNGIAVDDISNPDVVLVDNKRDNIQIFTQVDACPTTCTLSISPLPNVIVIGPTGSVTTTVTVEQTGFGAQNPTLNLFPFANTPGATFSSVTVDGTEITGGGSFGSFKLGSGATSEKDLIATYTTAGSPPGDFVAFFDVETFGLAPNDFFTPLDIPVFVIDPSIPVLKFNVTGAANNTGVLFDGFNLVEDDVVTLEIFGPGFSTGSSLAIDSFSIVKGSDTVTSAGRIQGEFIVPASISVNSTYALNLTTTNKVATEELFVFDSRSSGIFSLNIGSPSVDLSPPDTGSQTAGFGDQGSWISYNALGGFTGEVNLEIIGLPPGVNVFCDTNEDGIFGDTCDLLNPNGSGDAGALLFMSFTSALDTPPGFYDIIIEGSDDATNTIFAEGELTLIVPCAAEFEGSGDSSCGFFSASPENAKPGDLVILNGKVPDDFATDTVSFFIGFGDSITTLETTVTIDSTGKFTASFIVPTSLPNTGYNIGYMGLEAAITNGPVLFTDFYIQSDDAVFTATISPDYITPIESGNAGTSDHEILLTLTGTSGGDTETIELFVFGLPPGLTVQFDGSGTDDEDGFDQFTLPAGGKTIKKIKFNASNNPPPGTYFVFLDICPTTVITGFECFFFDLSVSVLVPSGFGFADLTLNNQNNATLQTISGTVRNMGFSETVSIDFAGTVTNIVTPAISAAADGNKTFSISVPNLSAGIYPVKATNTTNGIDAELFTIIAGTDTFATSISPQSLPAIIQGATLSDKATFTIEVIGGKDLSACDGVASVELFGLPPGVTGVFGSGQFTQFPTTTLSIPTGIRFNSTTIQLTASSDVFPGPINAFIEAECGTEFHGSILESAVLTGTSNFDFGGGFVVIGAFNDFNEATVLISPLNVESGDVVTIQAYGYKPNDTPTMEIFTGSSSVSVTPNNPITFSEKGNFTVAKVTIPNISSGFYEFDVFDSIGTFGTAPFTVLSATDTFKLSVEPGTIEPVAPVTQGDTSETITVSIKAIQGKTPGTVTVSVFGVPPGLDVQFDGASSTTKSLTVGTGLTKTTKLTFIPSTSTPPGFYFMTIEADDSTNTAFFDLDLFVLPSGDLGSSYSSFIVSPPFGIAGDSVTVQGSGFTSDDSVSLTIGGSTVETGGSKFSGGEFSATINIPSSLTTPGLYPAILSDESGIEEVFIIEIIDTESSFILDVSPDYISPVIQGDTSDAITAILKTPKGKTGSTTTIEVEGLPPGVDPRFDGNAVEFVDLRLSIAGGSNNTKITFVVDDSAPPGFYQLFIIADDGTNFSVIPFGLSVAPDIGGSTAFATLTIFPDTVRPGEDLTLIGNGFVAGSDGEFSSLEITAPGDPDPTTVNIGVTVTPDTNGDFTFPLRMPSGTTTGVYTLSVTSGDRLGQADVSVIPTSSFYDVDVSPDFLKIIQGASVTDRTVNATISVKSFNAFSEDLELIVSELPLGMSIKIDNSSGNNIVFFNGTLAGNESNSTALLTDGNSLTPGKSKILKLFVGADSSTSVGTYQLFVGAEDDTNDDVRGRPIAIQVLPTTGGALTISPPGGQPTSKATISGSGFAAGTITLEFGGLTTGESSFATIPTTITAASDFTSVITIPSVSPGVYTISATDSNGDSVFTQYKVFPNTSDTFALQVSPKKILIQPGEILNQTVTITPIGSFTSDITLSVSGLPAAFSTATFSPSKTITPVPGIPTLVRISADSNAAPTGQTAFSISGTDGSTTVTESASVNILSAGDFTFSLGPDEVILGKGGSSVFVNLQVVANTALSDRTLTVTTTLPTGITVNGSATAAAFDAAGLVIPIDSSTKSGSVVLEFAAGNTASSANSEIEITPSGNAAKAQNVTVSVLGGTIEKITNPCIDPTSISTTFPQQVLPRFSDGINPQFIFDSVTTDSSKCTEIFTTKSNNETADFGTLPDSIDGGGNQIFNVDVGSGNTQTDVKICLPSSILIDQSQTPILMFFNATLGEWVTVTTTLEGDLVCFTSDHTSSWAIGGVKALALGGAGGGRSGPILGLKALSQSNFIDIPDEIEEGLINFGPFIPLKPYDVNAEQFETFDFPFSIDNDGYAVAGYSNTLDTKTLNTGEATKIKAVVYMPTELEHVAFYTNIREGDTLDDSDTFLRFWKSETDIFQIKNENGFFEYIDLTIEEDGIKKTATFDIKFLNPMPKSDIVLRMWDKKLHSTTVIIFDAIEVVGPSQEPREEPAPEDLEIPEPGTTVPETSELRIEESPTDVPDWIKTSAKWWNEGHITDTDFARGIEYLIQNEIIKMSLTEIAKATIDEIASIPNWIKFNAGWWGDGLISADDFISGIKYLIERGIIKV